MFCQRRERDSPFFTVSKLRLSGLDSITAKLQDKVGINVAALWQPSQRLNVRWYGHKDRVNLQLQPSNATIRAALGPPLCRRAVTSAQDHEWSLWFSILYNAINIQSQYNTIAISNTSNVYLFLRKGENATQRAVSQKHLRWSEMFPTPIKISMPWPEEKGTPKACSPQIVKFLLPMQWLVRA